MHAYASYCNFIDCLWVYAVFSLLISAFTISLVSDCAVHACQHVPMNTFPDYPDARKELGQVKKRKIAVGTG